MESILNITILALQVYQRDSWYEEVLPQQEKKNQIKSKKNRTKQKYSNFKYNW